MFSKITILVNYNTYESKRYFSDKFAEALKRHGFSVNIIYTELGLNLSDQLKLLTDRSVTDLTCSFTSVLPFEDGTFLWDRTHIPHWSILIDPSYYSDHLFRSPYSIVSCVDRYDCEFARLHKCENVFFWPHAVERELQPVENQLRTYDVVFIGSCYDHENLQEYWRKSFPPHISSLIENSAEILLADHHTSLIPAVRLAMLYEGIDPSDVDMEKIVFLVDNYVRGKDRFELIRSIKGGNVHVFGGICWRDQPPVKDWSYNLSSMSNVTVHPSISFVESLEILKQSKICLNSMPFFKNGTHERIFTGLACGCLPITMKNLWVEENFVDGEELLVYRPKGWSDVNDKVSYYLNNEKELRRIVENGRNIVMKKHTWDNRVEEMKANLEMILAGMQD